MILQRASLDLAVKNNEEPEERRVKDRRADPRQKMPKVWICPNCGSELRDIGCKLRCTKVDCGYFESCQEW